MQPRKLLVVTSDDVGVDLHAASLTENIDSIAANGVELRGAWAASLCGNFRYRLLSGLPAFHPDNLIGGIIKPDQRWSPSGHYRALPNALMQRDSSLRSTLRGKVHFCDRTDPLYLETCGFADASGSMSNLDKSEPPGDFFDWERFDLDTGTERSGLYATADTARRTFTDIWSHVDLVFAHFNAPHAPHHVPPAGFLKRDDVDPTDPNDLARAMYEGIDVVMAPVLAAARQAGYTILYMGDNGTSDEVGGYDHDRGKGSLYESGLSVPCFIEGPGLFRGITSDWPVGPEDLYHTIIELVTGEPSFDEYGNSIASHLIEDYSPPGGASILRHHVFTDRFRGAGDPPTMNTWRRAVKREDGWKLIVIPKAPQVEQLYHLPTDPGERTNRWDADPEARRAGDALLALMPTLP